MALKGRWHKTINPSVNKFVGCYKQAVGLKKSGSSESDIILTAHDIFHHDMRRKFTFVSSSTLFNIFSYNFHLILFII